MKKHPLHDCMEALAAGMVQETPDPKAKEADSASANTQAVRARTREASPIRFTARRMREAAGAAADATGTKFRMIMLEEGMGNFGDAMYYTRQCLETGKEIFEGAQVYADHPDEIEEQTRPERSVRDLIGHWEDVAVEDGDDGQALLCGTIVTIEGPSYDWARATLKHAIDYAKKYPDKDFVGASINADGIVDDTPTSEFMQTQGDQIPASAKEKLTKALDEGVDQIRVATAFREAVSCDVVTKAGAGGRVLTMLEREKQKMKTKMKEDGAAQKDPKAKGADDAKGGADAGHDDADKDKALIQGMLDKHLGKQDHSEDTVKAATEAYQAAKEHGGMTEAEALEAAGHAMKVAQAMQKAKEGKGKESKQSEAHHKESDTGGKKLTLEEEVIQLRGTVARLQESDRKRALDAYLDTKLAETKLPRDVTKKFREAVKSPRNEKDVDEKLALFLEAYRMNGAGGKAGDGDGGFVLSHEKTEDVSTETGTGFGDCVED